MILFGTKEKIDQNPKKKDRILVFSKEKNIMFNSNENFLHFGCFLLELPLWFGFVSISLLIYTVTYTEK